MQPNNTILSDQAKKIAATLEAGQHKEGLLLNKRIKICQDAANLFERLESMTADELHKTVQPLMEESIDLPVTIMVRLVRRQCLEGMDSADLQGRFLDAWRPWGSTSGVEEFCPLTPKLDAVIACVSDKYQGLEEPSDDEEAAARLDQEQQLEYKVRFSLHNQKRLLSIKPIFKHIRLQNLGFLYIIFFSVLESGEHKLAFDGWKTCK